MKYRLLAVPLMIASVFPLLALYFLIQFKQLHAPIREIDAILFDAMANNLLELGSYSLELRPEMINRYSSLPPGEFETLQNPNSELRLYFSTLGLDGPTTFRPPFFPTILSSLYAVFGISFSIGRLFNVAIIFLGLLVLFASSQWKQIDGRVPLVTVGAGMLATVTLLLSDKTTWKLIGEPFSEPLAFFLLSLLISLALSCKKKYWRLIASGGALGLLALTRPFCIYWIPLITLYFVWQEFNFSISHGIKVAFLFLVPCFLLLAPWMTRNYLVLGEFTVNGSAGGIVLGEIYLDLKPGDDGNYHSSLSYAFRDYLQSKSITNSELGSMKEGMRIGKNWIMSNLSSLPMLMGKRLHSYWWLGLTTAQKTMLVLGILSMLVIRDRALIGIFLACAISQSIIISLSCNDAMIPGRYFFALAPILGYAVAMLPMGFWLGMRRTRRNPL